MIKFKGSHFERDVILWGIRWYVAYPISYRQVEEMMEERGVKVDHATLNRWVLKYVPLLEQNFRMRKYPIGPTWRLDETYVRVRGEWKYLYRAVDKAGATVDFLLTAERNRKAALRFLRKAIGHHGAPEKITIDKSGANTAAIESHNAEHEADIEIRQVKYLNNSICRAHRDATPPLMAASQNPPSPRADPPVSSLHLAIINSLNYPQLLGTRDTQ
jgi:putative transposase